MDERPVTEQGGQNGESGAEQSGQDGKALRKTFEEIREDARREILSSADREKLDGLEPDEREFVDQVCLFESKSQKVTRQPHKVKLREMLLCRDIAQAYCPGRDAAGQYSEGKRILTNSETGSDSVKFVLARKVCSMLDKINMIYQSNAGSFVRADLHRAETELLNYINRLGRMIREPLSEARRVYSKLRERAGWNLPNTAFAMAEDCDVPQIFFNRYSSPAQLLLKDPKKPFRSDNASPPLKLDFRIKNAVLIVAGENRFHLDHSRFEKVKDTAAARHIMMSSLQAGKDKIAELYRKNPYSLTEGFSLEDDINIQGIKEEVFGFFFSYTLKNLPSTASRADSAELLVQELMREENGLGCKGFCRFLYPPAAVEDSPEPDLWTRSATRAFGLRRLFQDIAERKVRLSMFPTRLNQLLTEYLTVQLESMRKKMAAPYEDKIKQLDHELQQFNAVSGSPLAVEVEERARQQQLDSEFRRITDEAFTLVAELLKKELVAGSSAEKLSMLTRVKPRLEDKITELRTTLDKLRGNFEALVERKKALSEWLVQAIDVANRTRNGENGNNQERFKSLAGLFGASEGKTFEGDADGLARQIAEQRVRVVASQERVKGQFDQVKAFLERLKTAVGMIEEAEGLSAENRRIEEALAAAAPLREREGNLRETLGRLTMEYEEKAGRIEEAIEVNKET